MIIFFFTLNMKKTANTPIATYTHTFFSTSNRCLYVSRCNRFLLLLSCAVCNFSFAFIWLFFLCRFHLTVNWDIFFLLLFSSSTFFALFISHWNSIRWYVYVYVFYRVFTTVSNYLMQKSFRFLFWLYSMRFNCFEQMTYMLVLFIRISI